MELTQSKNRFVTIPPQARRIRRWRESIWQLLTLPMLAFVVIPITAILLGLTPEAIWFSLQTPHAVQAIRLSVLTSLSAVGVSIIFGTPVAYLIYRKRTRFHQILDTLIDLPTVLPPAVAGVALLMAFGRASSLGRLLAELGIQLPFSTVAVVLAQTFIAAPLYIKSAALGFASVGCEIRRAAALDGANRWQIFRYIVLPISWQSLVSGCVLTWSRALGEFGATIIFAGNLPGRTQTMPLAIYLGLEVDLNTALSLSAILVIFSFTTLLVLKSAFHKSIDENFIE